MRKTGSTERFSGEVPYRIKKLLPAQSCMFFLHERTDSKFRKLGHTERQINLLLSNI